MKEEGSKIVDSKVIDAFHLMWGNFPEPATLVHKSKEIIAANAAGQSIGRVKGLNCAALGAPEAHRGCLANQALRTRLPAFKKTKTGEKEIISYWLPVEGYPELFIHFGVGVIIDYTAAPEKIPRIK